MTTIREHSEEQPRSKVGWTDVAEAIKFIDHLLETSDQSSDTSEWEKLKALLDQDRQPGRKLFPTE